MSKIPICTLCHTFITLWSQTQNTINPISNMIMELSVLILVSLTNHVVPNIDGLVQERCNSSALAMELRLSCTNPTIYDFLFTNTSDELKFITILIFMVFNIPGKLIQYHGCWCNDSRESGPHLNIKTVFPRYGYSHVKDKTVARPSYL